MNQEISRDEMLARYERYLNQEEKSRATIEKYLRDIRRFHVYLAGREVSKEQTLAYKTYLTEQYAPASVNSMLVALNCFLRFAGREDCCVRLLKIQRQIFCNEDRELTQEEYQRLIRAARDIRTAMVLRTICGTGIRVSELQYITVEAVYQGKAVVRCKSKTRVIFIPASLRELLQKYIKKTGLKAGAVFVTRGGKPLDRSSIWRSMKTLCRDAGVSPDKVFPHNLRHLFARSFYSLEKDIVRLADLLGHSSINTTRIYTTETGHEHISRLEQVQQLLSM